MQLACTPWVAADESEFVPVGRELADGYAAQPRRCADEFDGPLSFQRWPRPAPAR